MARYNGSIIQTVNKKKNNKTTGTGNNLGGTKAGAPGSRAAPPAGARGQSPHLRATRPYRWDALPA